MTDISSLTSQIKQNCNISDAKYWGSYTICGLLLWLRELYRFENRINHWEEGEKEAILEWISDREKLWAEIEDKDFIPIKIDSKEYPAFDTESINAALLPHGILYGAGYGQHMKPLFFLAESYKTDSIEGYALYVAGREYARDLTVYPAMSQDKKIIARREAVLLLLWDKFNELRLKRSKSVLSFAFNHYGVSPDEKPSADLNIKLMRIAESEIESYIYHEVGEITEGEKLGEQWKNFIFSLSNSRAELLARGIKDLLADTSEKGMLRYLIDMRKKGSLAFYVSSLRGYRKSVFGEISAAFDKFIVTEDWNEIENARVNCNKMAINYAGTMLELFRKKNERTGLIADIEKEFSCLL